MPNRIVREGILTSEAVSSLSWAEEVFYRRLMSVADDHGRFHASPKLIRAACYPLLIDKVSDADIGKWLTSCVTAALVSVYPAPDGKRYLQIIKFGQQVRSASKYPGPTAPDGACYQLLADAHLGVSVSEGVSVSSEANASDGKPSVDKSKRPKTPEDRAKSDLWKAAVAVLAQGGCSNEAMARSFMGKLVTDYGLEVVKIAVDAAVTAQPADAREYLKATCQRHKGERKDPVTVPSDAPEKTLAMLEAQRLTPEQRAASEEARRRVMSALKVVA